MRTLIMFTASLSLAGCISLSDSSSRVEGEGGETDACKIEGDDIGSDGLVMRLGPKTVTFGDWVAKDGEPNEYVGFSISITGASSVGYVVKASGETYPSRTTTWMHPAGAGGGPNAPGISNVDVCEECTDGSCDDGGGDGGGDDGNGGDDGGGDDGGTGECDGGDGCPGEGSGDGPLL